ncbi:MAG: sugar phosphate isomerase/epimerase family protein [Planctomycetota bacterium]
MRIGIVTDEITTDLGEALRLGREWGIQDFELRCTDAGRVPEIAPEDIDLLRRERNEEGIRITALSPGVFKTFLKEEETIRREMDVVLPASFRLAKDLATSRIIVFGFKGGPSGGEDEAEKVIRHLSEAGRRAAEHGMTLLVENEPGCWCDSGSRTAAVLKEVGDPAVRANWDPANAVGLEEAPFPDGYGAIRSFVANLHIKDTPKDPMVACVPVGEGKVDWEGQLRAVVGDGGLDHVVLETHCLPLIENSRKNLDRVREILARVSR